LHHEIVNVAKSCGIPGFRYVVFSKPFAPFPFLDPDVAHHSEMNVAPHLLLTDNSPREGEESAFVQAGAPAIAAEATSPAAVLPVCAKITVFALLEDLPVEKLPPSPCLAASPRAASRQLGTAMFPLISEVTEALTPPMQPHGRR
jgi:hypothetical protein